VTRALERLDAAIAELETEAPGWQAEMDLLRASRDQGNVEDWPEWCLLPGEAPYAIATATGLVNSEVINMTPVDQMAAFYAWLQGKNIW
jgi:phenolic acid decarboxylase